MGFEDSEFPDIDLPAFKSALGSFATGVTVATTAATEGLHGLTANAVMSVSLNPPLVLVSIQSGSRMHHALRTSDNFALSMLAASQRAIAEHFADSSRSHDAVGFAQFPHRLGTTGAPLLEGALAWVECRIVDSHQAGDHVLYIGRVMRVECLDSGDPLLYFRGAFAQLTTGVIA